MNFRIETDSLTKLTKPTNKKPLRPRHSICN